MNLITCKKSREGDSLKLGVGSCELGGFGRAAAVAFCAVVAACAIRSANAAIAFETKNENRNTYTFGTPVDVDNGETKMDNIGSEAEANPGRFTFRAGTVNIKEGGYVRVSSIGDTKDEKAYGNWIGNAGNPATLNISGGTFWAERVGDTTGSGFIRIGVSDKGSNTGTARINLSSGWLGADLLKCGGSTFNIASAKNTPAEMNMSGGKAVIDRFQIGASASGSYSSATFNMTGGEMEIGNYFEFCAYHNQSFNWGGGTIAAKKENIFKETSLLANCTRSVTLSGNPSVFDTGNFAQTIPVCIANATGDGTLKLTGGNRVTLTASPSYNLWLDDGTTLSISDLTIPADGSFTFSGKVTVDGALTLNSGAIIVCNVDAIPSSSVCALTVNDGFKLSDGRSVLDSVVISGAEAADYKKSISGNTIMVGKNDDPNYIWNGKGTNWSDADAWNNNGSTSVWYDNYNAIFNFADATATLGADVIANSLAFEQNATIDGSSYTLTVPTVSVAEEVNATISAPIASAFEKTGAGTLTLGSSRTDQTTVSEGTLAMSGSGTTLDWSKFTLGTAPDKPVTLRLENGAMPTSGEWRLGRANITSRVVKAEGDWSRGGYTIVIGNAEGADTTFIHEDGSLTCSGYLIVGGPGAANSTLILSGGVITNSNTQTGSGREPRTAIGYTSDGTLIVTNGASLAVTGQYLGISDANRMKGIVEIYDGSTVDVAYDVIFGQVSKQGWGEGKLNLHTGGTLSTKTIRCSTNQATPADATAEVNFDGGILKANSSTRLIQKHDRLTVNVSAKGGTINNNGKNIIIEESFNGPGTINLIGSGTTTFAAGVGAEGGVSVASGTTLALDGSVTFEGSVVFESGSTLSVIAPSCDNAALATPSISIKGDMIISIPSQRFADGKYKILELSDAQFGADVLNCLTLNGGKGDELKKYALSVEGNTIYLEVTGGVDSKWVGGVGDNRFSVAANWDNGKVPEEGSTLDLSGISADTTIIADAGRTFGAVTMGSGVVTFTNSFAASSFTDTAKIAVAADSTVTLDGDLVFANSTKNKYIVYTVAEGGVFRVTGRIVLTGFTGDGHLGGSVANTCPGTIAAKGLFNDCIKNGDNQPRFVLGRSVSNYHGMWAIGSDGLDGSGGFRIAKASNVSAMIVAEADFVDSANICNLGSLVIDAAGHEVALGTNTLAGSGGIYGGGNTTIVGGRVVANYDVDNLTKYTLNNPFTVDSGATLALMPGADVGSGLVTVHKGSTLEVASGEHTFDGGLTLNDGATLSFNFTQRSVTPQIAVVVTVNGEVKVKIPADSKWPTSGENVLTTCGGFAGKTVELVDPPNWVRGLSVNAEGNIVLDVKPRGTKVIVR